MGPRRFTGSVVLKHVLTGPGFHAFKGPLRETCRWM